MTDDVICVVGVDRRAPDCVWDSGHHRVLHVGDPGTSQSWFISVLLCDSEADESIVSLS